MFQLIGSLLGLVAIVAALVGAPVSGTVFAVCTFVWVVLAKPRTAARLPKYDAPWGDVYGAPFTRL